MLRKRDRPFRERALIVLVLMVIIAVLSLTSKKYDTAGNITGATRLL